MAWIRIFTRELICIIQCYGTWNFSSGATGNALHSVFHVTKSTERERKGSASEHGVYQVST